MRLSELESIPIDDEVGARDKGTRGDKFPLNDLAMFVYAIGFRRSFARDDGSQERKS